MTVRNLEDLLVEQLKDLYSAKNQAQSAYKRWTEKASSDALRQMFSEHGRHISSHKQAIEEICSTLNASPEGEHCKGMQGLITEADEFLEDSESGAIRDAGLIAMVQRVEHYGIAGFGCARTYAFQLGHEDAGSKLQNILDAEADQDERLTRLAEHTLNEEAMAEPELA